MAILHVRNGPEQLYRGIQKLAEEHNRSLTAEVIQLLDQGLRTREARQAAAAVVVRIRHEAKEVQLPPEWVDAATLIRKDRHR